MKIFCFLLGLCLLVRVAPAQTPDGDLANLPQAKDYLEKRSSSYDQSGGNADARPIAPGATLTLLDTDGPPWSATSGSQLPAPIPTT